MSVNKQNPRENGRSQLTLRQEKFCEEIVKGKSGKDAALAAGYSPGNADKYASSLLINPAVADRIRDMKACSAAIAEIEGSDVVREWARLGLSNILDVAEVVDGELVVKPSSEWPEAAARAVMEVTQSKGKVRVKMHPKQGALDSIGRYLGLLIDRRKHELGSVDGEPLDGRIVVTFVGGNDGKDDDSSR
jgi:phage terminase small subunit